LSSGRLPQTLAGENTAILHGISGKPPHSTLTAMQVAIQFKMKFVKKITNSTNRGRNQLFVRIGAFLIGSFGRLKTTHSPHLA
jgi:hypothetical protein